jgi:hypothetical protein
VEIMSRWVFTTIEIQSQKSTRRDEEVMGMPISMVNFRIMPTAASDYRGRKPVTIPSPNSRLRIPDPRFLHYEV